MQMDRKNSLGKQVGLCAASALIPCGILILALALLGAAPFGDDTILLRDSSIQYIDFASYLKTVFSGDNDIFYSFSKNLGGDMLSLLAYYLLSPFSLLFAFGNTETLPLVYTAVIVLKVSLCGLTFFWASRNLFGTSWRGLIFSTAYALMAYNTMYAWNIMWLDGVMVLPLLGLGLYRLWQGESSRLYVFSIAYSLLTNFYIGYMLCLSSVIFCLALMILKEDTWKNKCRTLGKFVFSSCVGGFASAFVWLPTFLSMLGGRASYDGSVFVWTRTFNILGLAGKLVAGASSPDQLEAGTPHIFCGTVILFLVLVFFLHRGISRQKRLVALGIIVVYIVSFHTRALDIIWHGFSPNIAFNFRYAFILSYVLILIAQYTAARLDTAGKISFCIAGGIHLALIPILLVMKQVMDLDFISLPGCLISAGTLLAAFLCLSAKARPRQTAGLVLLLACCFEMGANYYLSMKAVVGIQETLSLSEYQTFLEKATPGVEYVKARDDGFYRMEKTFERDRNDAMLLNYHGLSHFSSSRQQGITRFLETMGLHNTDDVGTCYRRGATAEADAFLGVKYVLSEEDLTASKGYPLLTTLNGVGVYENPYVLPIAMLSDEGIGTVSLAGGDYFAAHNRIWQGLTGTDEEALHKEETYTVSLENLFTVPMEDGGIRYIRENEALPASVRYEITVSQEMPLYFYFTSTERQDAEILVNGVNLGTYFSLEQWNMTYMGTYRPGDTVTVEVVLTSDQVRISGAYFYYEDLNALEALSAAVQGSPVRLTRQSSSCLTGSFQAEEGQTLLFTIPYDEGWRLYIDGAPAEFTRVLDVLFAAKVPAGQHTFTLRYLPKGLYAGCAISLAALLTAALWCLRRKKRH